MKLATLLSGVCVAHTLLYGAGNYLQEKWTYDNGVVRSCDALPDHSTIPVSQLSLLAPVLCTTPKVLEIAADTIIRSYAPIRTLDVIFHVHRGAHLTFRAPSVVLGRTETGKGDSILSGQGSVKFEVDSSSFDYLKGILTDEYGVVSLPYGSVDSDQAIRYTSTSIIAADPSAARKVTTEQVPLPPAYEEALARVHARINKTNSPTPVPGSPGGPDSSTSPASENNSPTSPTSPTSENDSPSLTTASTSDGDSRETGTIGSSNNNGDETDNRAIAITSTVENARPTPAGSNNIHDGGRRNLQGRGNNKPSSIDSHRIVSTKPTKPPPNSDSGWARPGKSVPRAPSTSSVKVGEKLAGDLITSDGTATVSFNEEDGSLRFSKELKNGPRDHRGRRIGPPLVSTVTLIPGDVDKMDEVFQRRKEIAAAAGKEAKKKGKVATVLGFLPYGKHGYRRRRALQHASAHLGEAELTVDARGTVEGSVDGTVVLRRRGPSFFGFRRKDSSHELQVDNDGLAVMKKGRRVWGVEAPDIWRRL